MIDMKQVSLSKIAAFSLLGVTLLMAGTAGLPIANADDDIMCSAPNDKIDSGQHVSADLYVDGDCFVSPNGSVDGNIIVEGGEGGYSLFMLGLLSGSIEAKDCTQVQVNSGATVDGNVKVEYCEASTQWEFDVFIGTPQEEEGPNPAKTTIKGNVEIKGSDLRLGPHAVVEGNVKVEEGNCDILQGAIVQGNLEGECAPDYDSDEDDDSDD